MTEEHRIWLRKKRIFFLDEMMRYLKAYSTLGTKSFLEYANKCGRITNHFKHRIEGEECSCVEDLKKKREQELSTG